MCDLFDIVWKPVIGGFVFLSIFYLLLWVGGAGLWGNNGKPRDPEVLAARSRRLALFNLWGGGLVAITMLVMMILGFWCAGSPGDIKAIVPN